MSKIERITNKSNYVTKKLLNHQTNHIQVFIPNNCDQNMILYLTFAPFIPVVVKEININDFD